MPGRCRTFLCQDADTHTHAVSTELVPRLQGYGATKMYRLQDNQGSITIRFNILATNRTRVRGYRKLSSKLWVDISNKIAKRSMAKFSVRFFMGYLAKTIIITSYGANVCTVETSLSSTYHRDYIHNCIKTCCSASTLSCSCTPSSSSGA